jgi:hypothetical protein
MDDGPLPQPFHVKVKTRPEKMNCFSRKRGKNSYGKKEEFIRKKGRKTYGRKEGI